MKTYSGGVDVGSTQTKAVVIDHDRKIVGRSLTATGSNVMTAATYTFDLACKDAGIPEEDVRFVVGTGYGRYRVTFGNKQITEISCHARGAAHMFPKTSAVLDMGGQDTKAIKIQPDGTVLDFCMNDKCAAGTGRFLQSAAMALEIPLDELGGIALGGRQPVRISTTCTVFAESEVLTWLSKGKSIEDILLGVHKSIASRSMGLMRRVGIEPEVTFTGGVTRNQAMVQLIRELVGGTVNVSEESHYMGALGAALFAMDEIDQRLTGGVPETAGASGEGTA